MILINLLPIELRQVEKKTSKIPVQKIVITVYGLVVLAILYHAIVFIAVRNQLSKMNNEHESIKSASEQAGKFMETVEKDLQPQKAFFDQYVISQVYISEIMNYLSDLVPDSMWFSQFRIRREKASIHFDLEGYTKVTSKQVALAQIQEYVNSVKAKLEETINRNAGPKDKARKVKVVMSTNREQMGSVEVMQFNASFQTV